MRISLKLSLKAKLTALISCLVLLVVMVTSTLYVDELIKHTLIDIHLRAFDVARRTYDQARYVLNQAPFPATLNPENPADLRIFARETLNADPQLLYSVQSEGVYSENLEYVAITDSNHTVVVHNLQDRVGRALTPDPDFGLLARAGLYRQLRTIYGPPRIYEVVYPIKYGVEPMDVRVGVSTALLGRVRPEIESAFRISLVGVLLSTLTAGLVSLLILRPLETISLNVDRLARGELPVPVPVSRSDEWGILSSKLNLLGERIRGEKAAFVALKENLDQLLASLADGLMFFDQQDRLVLATPAVARFLNRPVEQMLRQTPAEIFAAPDSLNSILRQAFAARRPVNGQTVEGSSQSQAARVAASVVFVEDQGSPVASLVTLRDAETRAQLENQIDTAAKMAAIGKLTTGVAHEVRNPLNAMVLQLEVLKAKLGDRDRALIPHLELLGNEIRRLDRVVRTFLDFTRPVELHPVETDLEGLVEEVFRSAEPEATRHQVKLVLQRNGGATARIDRDLMRQALLNLVLNGCQAMPSGGELRVSSRRVAQQVEIEVADQGVGIPPEDRSRIFSLYYTTKPAGTGVGLAMSYRIVQLHNGSMDFSSEVDRGTTFRLTLPR